MSYILAKDISRWQGPWQDTGEPIVFIKMSGGDDGLYMDGQATANYESAVQAGKAVGGYHFIGWRVGAEQEASYFLRSMSPLAENDVYALDVEAIPTGVDPVSYTRDMATYIHDHINVWPLVYMSLSTLNSYDWSSVLNNCGLWLADWAVSPDATIPTHYMYVMQQYSDGPNYDHDAWFGTIEQFKAYGYHAPQPTPEPLPEPQPTPVLPPDPVPTPQPIPPVPAPTPVVVPNPIPEPVVVVNPKQSLLRRFVAFTNKLIDKLIGDY